MTSAQIVIVILAMLYLGSGPQPVAPGTMVEAPDGQIHATFTSLRPDK